MSLEQRKPDLGTGRAELDGSTELGTLADWLLDVIASWVFQTKEPDRSRCHARAAG
jgi:hypothetical protein